MRTCNSAPAPSFIHPHSILDSIPDSVLDSETVTVVFSNVISRRGCISTSFAYANLLLKSSPIVHSYRLGPRLGLKIGRGRFLGVGHFLDRHLDDMEMHLKSFSYMRICCPASAPMVYSSPLLDFHRSWRDESERSRVS